MESITFTCETITPMFLAGADGVTPELRAPSIKGAMRFWWRAVNGHLGLEEMRKQEGELFGDTTQRSKIIIKTNFDKIQLKNKSIIPGKRGDKFKRRYNLDWQNVDQKYIGRDAGIGYLFYSVLFQGEGRSFIDTDFTFELTFSASNITDLQKIISVFWLFTHLGGIGTRVRRGAGRISAKIKEGENNLPKNDNLMLTFCNGECSILEYFKNNLKIIESIFQRNENDETRNVNSFTNLSNSSLIINTKGEDYWQGALSLLGNQFKNFREKHQGDVWKTVAFGLPIRHKKGTFVPKDFNGKKGQRRASPLFIGLVFFNNKYYPIQLFMSGDFLERNVKVSNGRESRDVSFSLYTTYREEQKMQANQTELIIHSLKKNN